MTVFEKSHDEIDGHRRFYTASHHALKSAGRLAIGLKIYGAHKIPETGGALMTINHRHWLEVFLGHAITDRHVSVIMKEEAYSNLILGYIFRNWDTISINRDSPSIASSREIISRLKDGRLVGVAVEGTRQQNERMGKIQRGAAFWTRVAKVPTIPSAIRGADSLPRAVLSRKAEILIGDPIHWPESKEDESRYTQELLSSTGALYDS